MSVERLQKDFRKPEIGTSQKLFSSYIKRKKFIKELSIFYFDPTDFIT